MTGVQTAAATLSLLNDSLISKGKAPLGFLNPWLYSAGLGGLNDIISGCNPGSGTEGFSATVGWDPVCPARVLNFHFRCLLIFESIGDRSWDAKLLQTAENTVCDSNN